MKNILLIIAMSLASVATCQATSPVLSGTRTPKLNQAQNLAIEQKAQDVRNDQMRRRNEDEAMAEIEHKVQIGIYNTQLQLMKQTL